MGYSTQDLVSQYNEPVFSNTYDEDTGLPTPDTIDHEAAVAAREAVGEGNLVKAMTQTEGWSIIRNFIDTQIESYQKQLVVEKEIDLIRRCQEHILALNSILRTIQHLSETKVAVSLETLREIYGGEN